MSFRFLEKGGIEFLAYQPWIDRGIVHGFTTSAIDFSPQSLPAAARRMCQAFAAGKMLVIRQMHGADIVGLTKEDLSLLSAGVNVCETACDGMEFNLEGGNESRAILGIRTADCLPVILLAGSRVSLVHAGWRGLAAGILEKAVNNLIGQCETECVEVVIGPAAGRERYSVGQEVIDALGVNRAVFARLPSGELLLDLSGSAEKIIKGLCGDAARVANSRICTISSEKFHSHRRSSSRAGRNIAFLVN